MRYIKPHKLKVMTLAFLGTGAFGIYMGLSSSVLYISLLGVINLCLGGFTGWLLLTQKPKERRKKRGR